MSVKKGKKRYIAGALFILFAIGTVMFAWMNRSKEEPPEYVFFYAENQGEDYPTTRGGQYFADLVEERTDGRIRIIVRPEGVMGTESEVLEQMRYGGIDFTRVSISHMTQYNPSMNVLYLPYLYSDSEHMWRVLDGEIGSEFLAGVQEIGLVGLSWYDAGARSFYNSVKPITSLEDMAGMKIRVQESDMMADMVKALGAEPIKGGYAEVYSGLERNDIQGAENNWPSYESMMHYEVAKYYTLDEHTRVPEVQLCSKHTWEKLSREDQEIVAQCAKESALYERSLWVEQEEQSKKTAIENGAEVIELSEEEKKRFREAVYSVYEKYCSDQMDTIKEISAMGNWIEE